MIKLNTQTTSTVTTNTFELEVRGQKVTYIEYLNDKNKVIDCSLRNEAGEEIGADDCGGELLEEIQGFIDAQDTLVNN